MALQTENILYLAFIEKFDDLLLNNLLFLCLMKLELFENSDNIFSSPNVYRVQHRIFRR